MFRIGSVIIEDFNSSKREGRMHISQMQSFVSASWLTWGGKSVQILSKFSTESRDVILGLKGDGTSRLSSSFQSMPLKKG